MNRLLLLLVVVFVSTWSGAVFAQATPPRAYIQIDGGSSGQLPLALAHWKALEGGDGAAAETMLAVVRRDLELASYFKFLDPAAFLEPITAGLRLGEFDFEAWRTPGAVGLVKAGLAGSGTEWTVDLHVYDVDAGAELLGRSISGGKADPRGLAHRVANAIVEAFTGKPGVFDTRIATVANFGSGKEIYLLDFDGSNPVAVTRNGSINLSPAVSPDGTRVLYTSYRDNNPDLWMTDLRTMRHTKLSTDGGLHVGAEWSPDGSEIAITMSKDGDSDIYVLDAQGKVLRRLTREWGIDVSPTWSPDSQWIAFCSSRNGNPQIFVMDRNGTQVRQLTHLGGHNVSPSFSPDGRRVVFAGRDEGRFDIFAVGVDGSGLRRLTQNSSDDEDPTWSPDGNHVVFSSTRDGRGRQLYIMTQDGRAQQRLTDGAGSYSNPNWGGRGPGPSR